MTSFSSGALKERKRCISGKPSRREEGSTADSRPLASDYPLIDVAQTEIANFGEAARNGLAVGPRKGGALPRCCLGSLAFSRYATRFPTVPGELGIAE